MDDVTKISNIKAVLLNPAFIDTMQEIKQDAMQDMVDKPWNDEGDAVRRKATLKIAIVDEIIGKLQTTLTLRTKALETSTNLR